MGLPALVAHVSAWFAARKVQATAVYGERARPAQGNARPGSKGGRVSFVWTGKGSYQGPKWLGARAHEDTIPTAGLVVLVNDVARARHAHHEAGPGVHLQAGAVVPWTPATTLIEAIDLGNAVRALELAHVGDLALHGVADAVNVITAPAASSAATLRTLLLELKAKGNAHNDVQAGVHGEADDPANDCTAGDPLSTSAKSKAILQFIPEIEAEIWAWDDTAPTDDAAQWAAWFMLHELTLNAIRAYARGVWRPERTEKASEVVHVTRGRAALVYIWLPIPVHELPAVTPLEVTLEILPFYELPKGTTPEGVEIPPVLLPVIE